MKKLKLNNTNNRSKTTVSIEGMDLYTLCRWASLKEAIDLIGEKCDERQIDFDEFNDLKPLDILHYVETMTDELYNKLSQNSKEPLCK